MTIGMIGSRRRDTDSDFKSVLQAFEKIYSPGDTLVSGHCPQGGDRFAEIIAEQKQIPIKLYPANWKLYGRSAGFKRNGLIAADADVLIACVAPDRTGGTEDTIKKYQNLGKRGLILV